MTEAPSIQYEMPKAYEPGKIEERWYDSWLEQGYFTPKIDPKRKPFVLIMPPPNVTGELHLGHALTTTLEDIIVRWHRMKGEPTLWIPGTDHAGIATQVVVEQQLAKQGLTKKDMGKEEFLKVARLLLPESFEIELWPPSHIQAGRINVPTEVRHNFPDTEVPFKIQTDIGDFKVRIKYHQGDKVDYIHFRELFRAHPQLKAGDRLIIHCVEPMQLYRIEISSK